jgi:SagB-type dehydrogenase family enzyme
MKSNIEVIFMTKDIGKEFMEKTKYKYLGTSDQRQGKPAPPLQLAFDKSKKLIDLPKPADMNIPRKDLREAIEERVSVRKYADKAFTIDELAWLLWATQGVKQIGEIYTKRTVPSAGARHAFETFVLVNKVEGLAPGVYRYLAIEHKLVEYDLSAGIADKLAKSAYGQDMVKDGAATFIWVAVTYRIAWRYQVRSYRYLHLDVGHVCQNLYLACENINAGCCAIAAYIDEEINEDLGLDGEELFVIYLASLGKK